MKCQSLFSGESKKNISTCSLLNVSPSMQIVKWTVAIVLQGSTFVSSCLLSYKILSAAAVIRALKINSSIPADQNRYLSKQHGSRWDGSSRAVSSESTLFASLFLIHYENMPIQINWKRNIFKTKKGIFSDKKFWYFSYFVSKHRLWYSLEPARLGGSNEYPQSMSC